MKIILGISLLMCTAMSHASEVVLYRDKGWPGPLTQMHVLDTNGAVKGWVRKNTFIRVNVDDNTILVEAGENVGRVVLSENDVTYIRVIPKLGIADGRVELEVVEESTFNRVLPKLSEAARL